MLRRLEPLPLGQVHPGYFKEQINYNCALKRLSNGAPRLSCRTWKKLVTRSRADPCESQAQFVRNPHFIHRLVHKKIKENRKKKQRIKEED